MVSRAVVAADAVGAVLVASTAAVVVAVADLVAYIQYHQGCNAGGGPLRHLLRPLEPDPRGQLEPDRRVRRRQCFEAREN